MRWKHQWRPWPLSGLTGVSGPCSCPRVPMSRRVAGMQCAPSPAESKAEVPGVTLGQCRPPCPPASDLTHLSPGCRAAPAQARPLHEPQASLPPRPAAPLLPSAPAGSQLHPQHRSREPAHHLCSSSPSTHPVALDPTLPAAQRPEGLVSSRPLLFSTCKDTSLPGQAPPNRRPTPTSLRTQAPWCCSCWPRQPRRAPVTWSPSHDAIPRYPGPSLLPGQGGSAGVSKASLRGWPLSCG